MSLGYNLRNFHRFSDGQMAGEVDPSILRIDRTYQRTISIPSFEKISREFDPQASGIIAVCLRKRDKRLYVVDGQHRLSSAIENELDKIKIIIVASDTTRSQEADIFVKFNTNRPVLGNSRFRARLVMGVEPEILIQQTIVDEGFALSFLPPGRPSEDQISSNSLYSETSILALSKKYGLGSLRSVLVTLKSMYGNSNRIPFMLRSGQIIRCIGIFMYQNKIHNTSKLSSFLRSINVERYWNSIKHGSKRQKELINFLNLKYNK